MAEKAIKAEAASNIQNYASDPKKIEVLAWKK